MSPVFGIDRLVPSPVPACFVQTKHGFNRFEVNLPVGHLIRWSKTKHTNSYPFTRSTNLKPAKNLSIPFMKKKAVFLKKIFLEKIVYHGSGRGIVRKIGKFGFSIFVLVHQSVGAFLRCGQVNTLENDGHLLRQMSDNCTQWTLCAKQVKFV